MTPEDIDAIRDINLKSWSGFTTSELLEQRHGLINGRSWQERITNDVLTHIGREYVTTFVAELDGEVVGYAAAQIEVKEDGGEVGIVSYNAVRPEARRLGIGTALVSRVVDYLKSQGARVLLVWTLKVGESARNIYERIGFEELTRHVYYSMEV
jgi:GNAT superfamily N-acetyltransferase